MKIASRGGFSILEALITSSIVIIMGMALASLTQSLMKEFKGLSQKADAAELRIAMILAFSNSNVCSWQLKDKVINVSGVTSTNPSTSSIAFNTIYSGLNTSSYVLASANTSLTAMPNSLSVGTITMRDIFATGVADEYTATMYISFNPANLVRPLKDATAKLVFNVDPSDAAGAKKILDCSTTGARKYHVSTAYLKMFHTSLEVDCSNMNTGKMFWDAACNRYCSTGCTNGTEQACSTLIPSKGYAGGLASECAGESQAATCTCFR